MIREELYLIEILHQTTTAVPAIAIGWSCILSKFYIKPQPCFSTFFRSIVVSYRNSTSNHNILTMRSVSITVVSYRNSTSNHNYRLDYWRSRSVVSYRNSTSNHNQVSFLPTMSQLYLIEILHQTTTVELSTISVSRCILSKFYIKPQPRRRYSLQRSCCILSKFYIKPQLSCH